MANKTVSYSLDEDIVEGIAEVARHTRTSKSDVVRAMYVNMQLERTLNAMREKYAPRLEALGNMSEDELAVYLKQPTSRQQ